jgi:PAS domain S-box-containing protein
MTERGLEEMSREELIRELRKLQTWEHRLAANAGEPDREGLLHDLRTHQVELEMQNRELRETEQRLQEATKRYTDLYDFAPVGYCTLDPKGIIREINLAGALLLGALRSDLVGKPFSVVARLTDRMSFVAHLKRSMAEKTRVASALHFLGAGKHGERVVQLVSDPELDETGAITAYRTILVDISELEARERRLRLMADAGQSLAQSLDPSAAIAAAARAAVPALGDVCIVDLVSESGTLERKVVRFADPAQQQLADEIQAAAPRPGWVSPQSRVVASGEPMLLAEGLAELQGHPTYDERDADVFRAARLGPLMVVPLQARGLTLGALTLACTASGRRYSLDDLTVARDLARRVATALDNARLYADAQRAIAARDAALALVSHDLRNPLGVILMGTALLLNQPAEADRRATSRKSIEAVRRSAERMSRLIQDLLDISSIEAGRFAIARTRQDVEKLTHEVVEELQIRAAAKSVRLTCDVAPTLGIDVECDRERLGQVLGNLIDNAIKFTDAGGTIGIRAELRDGEVRFSVTDTGRGILPADLPHVFDRYWRAQKTARAGTGLGLSIAKGIVEAHGGRIWVESKVRAGSAFYFTIPRAKEGTERIAPASPTTSPVAAREPERVILVAEDDVDLRELLCETLEREGYKVATVGNGAQALEYLHRERTPLLVVLDLTMPVMDGWGFLAERSRNPDLRSIPVIVVSGQQDVERRVIAADARYLPKPVRGKRLIDVMEQALAEL